MAKLEPSKQFKPSKAKVKEILEGYGLLFIDYQDLDKGVENTSLKVFTKDGVFVLRVLRIGKKSDSDLVRELDFMKYLRTDDLPVPEIFQTSSGKKFYKFKDNKGRIFKCVLMEFMPGKHVTKYSRLQLANLAQTTAKLENLGESYAEAYGIKAKPAYEYNLIKPKFKINNPSLKDFFNKAVKRKVRIIPPFNFGFHHVDLDNSNILFKGNKVSAILDFDDCMPATTVHDLAALVEDIVSTNLSIKDADYFLNEYSKYKILGDEIKYLKSLALIFSSYYAKIEIEVNGQKSKHIPNILKLGQLLEKWNSITYNKI